MKVDVKVGLNTEKSLSGIDGLKSTFRGLRRGLNEEFGAERLLAVGAIFETLKSIVEEGSRLVHVSERFGLGTDTLQRFTNLAKEKGATLEDVAASENKLIIAQDKATTGDEKITAALDTLKIKTDEFVNASPDEVLYMVADAIKDADDDTRAYAASVALMGRNAGVLFSTLKMGADEIRQQGGEAGVMKDQTAHLLHDFERQIQTMIGHLKVWASEGLAFAIKVAESAKVLATGGWDELSRLWGGEGDRGRAAKEMSKLWGEQEAEQPKKRAHLDLEDSETELAAADRLKTLYAQIDRMRAEQAEREMDAESRLQSMMRRVADLYEKAAAEADPEKQATLWLDAQNVEKDVTAERERVAAEEDKRQDALVAATEELAEKQLATALEAARDAGEKLAVLAVAMAEMQQRIAEAADEEERLRLTAKKEELEKQMAAIGKTAAEVAASRLAKIGGGGGAHLTGEQDFEARTAAAYAKSAKLIEQFRTTAGEIRQRLKQGARWS